MKQPTRVRALSAAVFSGALLLVGCSAGEPEDMSKRIEKSCQDEFGSRGEEAVNECRIRLSIEYIHEAERAKMNSARRSAGL